jgi:dGTPase
LPRDDEAAWWARHPLAFLVEAADDICYRLVDFEDGFRMGELEFEEVSENFRALIPVERHPKRLHDAHSDNRRVQILRDIAIGCAIEETADLFLESERAILAGDFDEPLIDIVPSREAWRTIQQRSIETIYATTRGVEIEAAGFEVLGGLLDIFVSALNDVAASARPSPRSRKLLQLVPAETLGPNRTPAPEPYQRLLKMLDFVSGMTDSYAVTLYKKVRGISLPGQ